MPDVLHKALGDVTAKKIQSGDWEVLAIAGGPSLQPAATFLRGFEIEPSESTVIIVCDRKTR